jgi:hypothetical protein
VSSQVRGEEELNRRRGNGNPRDPETDIGLTESAGFENRGNAGGKSERNLSIW